MADVPEERLIAKPSRRGVLLGAMGVAGVSWLGQLAGCRCSREREPVAGDGDEATAPPPELPGFPLPEVEPVIRVRVLRTNASGTRLTLGTNDQWLRLTRPDAAASAAVMQGPIQLTAVETGWSIVDSHGFRPRIDGYEKLQFEPVDDAVAGIELMIDRPVGFTSDDEEDGPAERRTYAGGLVVTRQLPDAGAIMFELINYLHLEDYLPGVLVSELYSHWEPHAYAALAVAARSYAAFEHLFWKDRRRYDVTSSQRSQVYRGVTVHDVAQRAVAHTRGMMLSYTGRVIPAYYSSCCGGRALSAADAFGANATHNVPPLAGRAGDDVCTSAPVYEWDVTRTADDLHARLTAYAGANELADLANIGLPRLIMPSAENQHGRPTRYRIDDGRDVVEIDAERLRVALNYRTDDLPAPERAVRSSFFDVSISNRGEATIAGRGYGHGVGLCQWGAQALAEQGRTWDEIIDWYYPGGDVVSAYG